MRDDPDLPNLPRELPVVSAGGTVRLVSISKIAVVHDYRTSNAKVGRCAYSPDGKLLAATSGSNVDLWNLRTGQRVFTLSGHPAFVSDCVFTADAGMLITASYDRSVRVWLLRDRRPVLTLYSAGFTTLAAGPGNTFAAGDTVGRVSLLRMKGVELGAAYVTATHFYRHGAAGTDQSLAVSCPRCCTRFPVPVPIQLALKRTARMGSRAELLPDEAWQDPLLRSQCEHCQNPLHFNPFVADGRGIFGWRARLAQTWRSIVGD